jgi:pimeloyl-ACP methyl ester carboxylesterase
LVVAELIRHGHTAIAVDLPGADPEAGLFEYRDIIVDAATNIPEPVTIVAQSLGGFSASLACDELEVERLVLVNAMIPRTGETAGQWWESVGWEAAAQAAAREAGRPPVDVADLETIFFHDVPAELVEVMRSDPGSAEEGPAVFSQPWPLTDWPEVPTIVLTGRDDRLFPLALQRRVAADRLHAEIEVLDGGHLVALSNPDPLVERLERTETTF